MTETQSAAPGQGPLQFLLDRQLPVRIVSGIALAVIAASGAILGGWWAAIVVGFVTVAIHQEWTWLTEKSRHPAIWYTLGLVLAIVYMAAGLPQTGLAIIAIAIAAAAVTSGSVFRPLGVAYAALFPVAILLVRYSPAAGEFLAEGERSAIAARAPDLDWGLGAMLLLFGAVWGTDIVAFFVGRVIGGPRLWPSVSPNKTWAGAIGGLIGGVVTGLAAALWLALPVTFGLVVFLLVLSLSAEAGDLFESWIKRLMGAKDSGWLLPGHGGFMDRVDGMMFAAGVALLVGWLRAGPDAIAPGIVLW